MEKVENLDVREVREALKGVGIEPFRQTDACLFAAPEIVFGVRTNCFDETNGFHMLDHVAPPESSFSYFSSTTVAPVPPSDCDAA
jgi:hypothetical protein